MLGEALEDKLVCAEKWCMKHAMFYDYLFMLDSR